MLHCSAVAVDPTVTMAFRGTVQPKFSCERNTELVLAAAREYFSSSANLMDNCMELARCCLQLITDCPAVIQEELDLISGLTQLEEFGVKILPFTSEQNKMTHTAQFLWMTHIALAVLDYSLTGIKSEGYWPLDHKGDDSLKRKGRVLDLLAEQALQHQDHKAATFHCQELMAIGQGLVYALEGMVGENADREKQGCNPFYESVLSDPYVDKSSHVV
ncbi:UNVERIFIED_CONTAM: hypothetical protein FKN15_069343 [Acipenser sinensis]